MGALSGCRNGAALGPAYKKGSGGRGDEAGWGARRRFLVDSFLTM